jgi:hypothetical protein
MRSQFHAGTWVASSLSGSNATTRIVTGPKANSFALGEVPDDVGRRLDRDRPRGDKPRIGPHVVAAERRSDLVGGRSQVLHQSRQNSG